MPATTIPLRIAAAILFVMPALSAVVGYAQPQSDDAFWAGAEERIERYRKADATVTVVDAEDRPVAGAEVHVSQTRHAFLFGCNIFAWGRVGDAEFEAKYRRRFADVFNYATLGFYWQSYERQQGEPRHAYTEDVAQWCRQQAIDCKGHPLAWNYRDPNWLPDDPQEVLRLQLARIEDCVRHFRGQIDVWDVVNEGSTR